MKAVRFRDPSGSIRVGALDEPGQTVTDAGPAGPEGFVPSDDGWNTIAAAGGQQYSVSEIQLLHPVVPNKIVAIGLNYRDHAAESELDIPSVPVVFAKFPSSLIGSNEAIVIPQEETRPDFEGELAVVIGRRVYRADEHAAIEAVGGISAIDDVSGRRAQLETPLRQFTLGKSFDTFTPMGPCIRSMDGINLRNLSLRTTVSSEVMQESNTKNLIFSVVDIIMYCSKGMTLEPGDVIATGTPSGVGDSRKPPRYLRDGDTVEIWVDGVGTLSNPVAFERA